MLGAALVVTPLRGDFFEAINLRNQELDAAGIAPIAAASGTGLAPHLMEVIVSEVYLDDEGAKALAKAMP